MDNLAQTGSELRKGKITKKTRQEISEIQQNIIECQRYRKISEEKMGEKERKYGRDSDNIKDLRKKGLEARLACIPFDFNNFENDIDRNCYRAGFVENGNRIILGLLEKLTPEQLEAYGRNDYISGIEPNEIPEKIRENQSYTNGYMMAVIMDESKGKGKR